MPSWPHKRKNYAGESFTLSLGQWAVDLIVEMSRENT